MLVVVDDTWWLVENGGLIGYCRVVGVDVDVGRCCIEVVKGSGRDW